jgi:hypothetical protein
MASVVSPAAHGRRSVGLVALAQASSGYRQTLPLSASVVKERSTADKYQLTNYCYNCSISAPDTHNSSTKYV